MDIHVIKKVSDIFDIIRLKDAELSMHKYKDSELCLHVQPDCPRKIKDS